MQKKRECWTIWSTSPPALAKRCPKMLTISESSSPSRKPQSTSPPTWVMVLHKKENVKGCHRLHWWWCKACLQQHSLWKSCCLLRPKSRNQRFSCRKAASPCKRGWSSQICKGQERLHLLAFETTMKLVKSYACTLPLALEGVHGVGAKPAATQAAIHVPSAALHARIAAGTPAPAVTVPKVAPAAA